MSSFEDLPPELQRHVAESCNQATLLSFATASKALYQLIIPIIYRVVELSSHNGSDIHLIAESFKVPPDWARRRDNPIDEIVYDKQRAFIRTLRSHPSLGKHVRTLRWTTVDYSKHVFEDEITPLWNKYEKGIISRRKLRMSLEEYDFNDCTSYLWDTFATFTHVQEVDIAFINDQREASPPPPLFQQAKCLRLSGMASSFLIRSMLKSVNPRSLYHLHLNNLNQFAELEDVQEELTLREKGKLRPFPQLAGTAGPMRTHLLKCSSKWCNLQSLIIDTVGLTGPQPDRADETTINALEVEQTRYRELGVLIKSVAKTLKAFRFQQGPTTDNYRNGWRRPRRAPICSSLRPPRDGLRPMDALFHQHILSAILESTWPQLEKMELFGVASNTTYPNRAAPWINRPLSDEIFSRIRTAVGPNPVLDIRTDATRLFWLVNGSEGPGVPEVDSGESTEDEEESENGLEE
ncbi:uncharacterized protein GGS22DRAFT_15524 [Annulohypoxylon maeteangense]|uniref:uncharacterized protein n=1 Tax=Annulohypoxylon maeteangense TaxID=1927788 RepID=UPI0020073A41|nr:uncharacterized protein GGS22DRAFT_15524 [Annulohypoxylon maeteangense]KAI0890581.1 hypothetical protein GGS22DRAFT_15524 [Annulohypoxylon maeteangense]